MLVSIIMVFRIRAAEFHDLWNMTLKSIDGLMETIKAVDYELIIIDNGSHSPEYSAQLNQSSTLWNEMHSEIKGIRVLRFEEHGSLARAWNEGVNQADGDFILMANNDIIYHQVGWLPKMLDALMDTSQKVGMIGIQHMSWYKFAFAEGSLFIYPTSFREEFNLKDGADEDDPRKYILFDERFELSCEDVDLNYRVQQAGYTVGQVHPPLQPVYMQHVGHQTINSLAHHTDVVRLTHQARIALCEKWGFEPQVND